MTKIGTFDIEESFNITGRGIVVVGYCGDFTPKFGMSISLVMLGKIEVFKIVGIEIGNMPKDGKKQFGLLLRTTPDLMKYITENKIINQTSDVLID